jgi:hypothetical protein
MPVPKVSKQVGVQLLTILKSTTEIELMFGKGSGQFHLNIMV